MRWRFQDKIREEIWKKERDESIGGEGEEWIQRYREGEGDRVVSQARPNQPQCRLLSVSHTCMILKVICAWVGWVWLARLVEES